MLRWHMDLGLAAVPKSADPQRIKSNIDAFDFALAPEDVPALTALDTGAERAADSDVFQPGLRGRGRA